MACNTDSLSLALNHIQSLISGLNKKNYKGSCAEINHLVQQHGNEAERHTIRCLFSHIDFSSDGKSTNKDYHQIQYLNQEFSNLVLKPNFVSLVCYAVDKPLGSQKSLRAQPNMLHQITKVLKLNRLHEVLLGIALLNSTMPDTRNCARAFVQQKLPEFLRSYTDAEGGAGTTGPGYSPANEFRLSDMSVEVLRLLLQAVLMRDLGVNAEQRETFLRLVRNEHPRERFTSVLSPLLYCDERPLDAPHERLLPDSRSIPRSALELSLSDVVLELGASCSSTDDFRRLLNLVGLRDINSAVVAKVLGSLARAVRYGASDAPVTLQLFENAAQRVASGNAPADSVTSASFSSSFGTTQLHNAGSVWNLSAFVDAVIDTLPTLRWRDVVAELDYPSFAVTSRDGFLLLISGLLRGLRDSPFPIELIYQRWKNTEGQLSFIGYALRNPDLFCFAQYPCRRVSLDMLKVLPEYDDKVDVQNWKSLDLIECLLRLSDNGVYMPVLELFRQPHELCPDLLLVGILQAAPQIFNSMKREIIYSLIPIFLAGHANASGALHYVWHCQANASAVRALVLHAITDWYMRAEPDASRLSRIVDVMHELKALSVLLNSPNFLFVIDLACLAARREYVKLDKWLTDKMREHGESFVQAVVAFLRRRCPTLFLQREELAQIQPQLLSFAPLNAQSTKMPVLNPELVTTVLGCLQTFSNTALSHELTDAIMFAVNSGAYIFQVIKSRERAQALLNAQQTQTTTKPSAALLNLGTQASGDQPYPIGNQLTKLPSAVLPSVTGSTQPGTNNTPFGNLSKASKQQNAAAAVASVMSLFGNAQSTTGTSTPLNSATTSSTNLSLLAGPNLPFGLGKTLTESPTSVFQHPSSVAPPTPAQMTVFPSGLLNDVAQKCAVCQFVVNLSKSNEVDVGRLLKDLPRSFGADVESDANAFFKKIFANAMPLDEILYKLKEMSTSDVQRSREGYFCILRNLLEEQRFYQQYPYEALIKTGMLIGGLIDESLVQASLLAVILFIILDALKLPVVNNPKMFDFACTALDRCRARLKDYPPICELFMRLPSYSDMLVKKPALAEYIEYACRGLEPPSPPPPPVQIALSAQAVLQSQPAPPPAQPQLQPQAQPAPSQPSATSNTTNATQKIATVSNGSTKTPSLTSTNIETLVKAAETEACPVSIPSEQVQDRIFFIFNNLSQSNMAQKAAELREHVPSEFLTWVAQYLVMKRVTIEPNFHGLYASFVDALSADGLYETILSETYRNIHILLQQPKDPSNFTDRGLLKSLGHWLGLITIARNKPILHDDLDVKSLLYEAFHRGANELNSVVPFVGRILESCAVSRVFRPPNPWTLGLLNVFAELRQQPDVKLPITFEVEVACRVLNVKLEKLKPSGYLANTARMARIVPQLVPRNMYTHDVQVQPPLGPAGDASSVSGDTQQPEFTESEAEPQTQPIPEPANAAIDPAGPAPLPPPPPRFTYDELNADNVFTHLTANESLPLFQRRKQLRVLVRTAAERTIQELAPLIIDRVAQTAVSTCEAIVIKDFAYDSDENRFRQSARAMCRSLTAGLALALARELVAVKLREHLEKLLAFTLTSPNQREEFDFTCESVTLDNCELVCAYIQKLVTQHALELLDRKLQVECETRRLARLDRRVFYNPKIVMLHQALPDQIRAAVQVPAAGRPSALAVYEEFARNVPGFAPPPSAAALELPLANARAAPLPQPALPPAALLAASMSASNGAALRCNDLLANVYDRLVTEVEARTAQFEALTVVAHGNVLGAMRALHDAIVSAQRARDIFSANALVGKVVENLLETYLAANFGNELDMMRRFGDMHVDVLKALADRQLYGASWTVRQCTKTLIEFRSDSRFNIDAVELLLKSRFINMQVYDSQLAQTIESHSGTLTASSGAASLLAHAHLENALSYLLPIAFAIHLLNRYCVSETRDGSHLVNTLNECELYLTIEQLNRIVAQARHFFEQHPNLLQLYERTRQQLDSVLITTDRQFSTLCQTPPIVVPQTNQTVPVMNSGSSSPLALFFSGMAQARDSEDPPGLREKSETLLNEWAAQLQSLPGSPVVGVGVPCPVRDNNLIQSFVAQLQLQGIFSSDETITRFLRINLESCIEFAYAQLASCAGASQPQAHVSRSLAYARIDSLIRLVALIIKSAGSDANPSLRVNLLNRVLGLTAGMLIHDFESARHEDLQNMPYHRILVMLLNELSVPDPAVDILLPHITIAFYNLLNVLRPSKCPGFIFSWLELVSHRTLLSRCVGVSEKRIPMGYSILGQLLLNLFKFLSPYLRNVYLTETVQTLYRGVMRFMLVLLHDFPEFLAESYYALIDTLPLNCIQLRNVILSASPRGIRLPDPIQFVRLDSMPEVQNDPRMTLVRATDLIRSERFKAELDGYLKTRAPVTFLSDLRSHLLRTTPDSPYRYNVQLLNGLVLYVGIHAVSAFKSTSPQSNIAPSLASVAHTPNMDIFQTLAVDLDSEGRYLFFNAIANHLRYPNTHTHYFHCVLLYLYKESNLTNVQEQITRVLLERVIVLRPHPWGILITLIELLRKPEFKFWQHDFLRFTPEIERLFDSVARSCLPPPLVQQALTQLQSDRITTQSLAQTQLGTDKLVVTPSLSTAQQSAIGGLSQTTSKD